MKKFGKIDWRIVVMLGILALTLITCNITITKRTSFVDGTVPPNASFVTDIVDPSMDGNPTRVVVYYGRNMDVTSFYPLHDLMIYGCAAEKVNNSWTCPQTPEGGDHWVEIPVEDVVPTTVGCPFDGATEPIYCFQQEGETVYYFGGTWGSVSASTNPLAYVWDYTSKTDLVPNYTRLTIFIKDGFLAGLTHPKILRFFFPRQENDNPDSPAGVHAMTEGVVYHQQTNNEVKFVVYPHETATEQLPYPTLIQPAHLSGLAGGPPATFPPHERILIKTSEPLSVILPLIEAEGAPVNGDPLAGDSGCEYFYQNQNGQPFVLGSDDELRIWRECGLPPGITFNLHLLTEEAEWWSNLNTHPSGEDNGSSALPPPPLSFKLPMSQDWSGARLRRGDTLAPAPVGGNANSGVYEDGYAPISNSSPVLVTTKFKTAPVRIAAECLRELQRR